MRVGGLAFFDILFTCLLLLHAEDDAEVAVGKAGAADAEVAYLAGALYVGSEAGAHVVVAHIDEAQRGAGIGGELTEVDAGGYLVAVHVAGGDGEVGSDDAVYLGLDMAYLLLGGAGGEVVVALALLAFDVVDTRAAAAEEAHHGLIQDVLGGVGRGKFGLVMGVEDRGCLHSVYILFAKIV